MALVASFSQKLTGDLRGLIYSDTSVQGCPNEASMVILHITWSGTSIAWGDTTLPGPLGRSSLVTPRTPGGLIGTGKNEW